MTETVFARWSCDWCGRRGMASGPRAGGSELPSDSIPVNCFYCFETVLLDAATGLDPRHVRVEGEYDGPHTASCPRCLGDVQTYWDGAGTPLLACLRCAHAERVPEPEVLEGLWEVLYDLHGERIERRELRAEGRARETAERLVPVKPRFPPVKKGHRGPRA